MYVDESGDTGLVGSPTNFFVLSGIVVNESKWRAILNRLIAFRKTLRAVHRLPTRTEIHASHYINHRSDGKDSAETLPIQMADVVAYFLQQRYRSIAYIKKQRAQLYFDRLVGAQQASQPLQQTRHRGAVELK